MFCFNFLYFFKLPIRNQNDTIINGIIKSILLMEGVLKKKPVREFARLKNWKTRNLEKFYKTF